jgi:monoamine oxidase
MSTLVPPERLAAFLTTSQAQLEAELTEEMVDAYGERARDTQAVFFRRWGVDPWTRGYITGWRPGDVMSVGPCTARTSRPSTSAAQTNGSAATWRERCAQAAPPRPPRSLLT